MRKIALLACLLALFPLSIMAQGDETASSIVRGDCTPAAAEGAALARGPQRRLPTINTKWDPNKTYRQLVVLFSFKDTDFKMEKPRETYDSIFNAPGYNQRDGAGCVADYFREQSGGLLNMQFDVYGPYKLDTLAQPYTAPTSSTRNYGQTQMREATRMLIAEHPDISFAPYDWDGNGYVNQVIFVYAGWCGNQGNSKCYGYIWPNTSSFSTITTPDGKRISNYTSSGELWVNNASCGIGTICHEFTHSLGLPDIYPVNGWIYSAVDEWDLMDGGNFTNYGWCPPNYSPLEKMLLGWLTPKELDSPASIKDMKTLAQGGEVYKVSHSASEYLLLENRQWEDWDYGLPGHGLVIYHVNYNASTWTSNTVNNTKDKLNYDLVHADNLSYDEWNTLLRARGVTSQNAVYQHTPRLNSHIMSGAAYPYATDSTETVDALTSETVPTVKMLTPDSEGNTTLQKPITNIRQSADGLVSFDFMKPHEPDAIKAISETRHQGTAVMLDLAGRRLHSAAHARVYIIKGVDGRVRKVVR